MGQPVASTVIKNLGTKAANGIIESVGLVGSNEKMSWAQQSNALVIKPLKTYPSENAVVYKINFKR